MAPKPSRDVRRRWRERGTGKGLLRDPLAPVPPLQLGGRLQTSLKAASIAVGRLDAIGTLSPNSGSFICGCVRERAVLSGRTEGLRLLATP